jgi:hypothetical protein
MCKIFSTYLGVVHISVQARLDCTSIKHIGGVFIRSHYSWHPPRRVPATLFSFLLKKLHKIKWIFWTLTRSTVAPADSLLSQWTVCPWVAHAFSAQRSANLNGDRNLQWSICMILIATLPFTRSWLQVNYIPSLSQKEFLTTTLLLMAIRVNHTNFNNNAISFYSWW